MILKMLVFNKVFFLFQPIVFSSCSYPFFLSRNDEVDKTCTRYLGNNFFKPQSNQSPMKLFSQFSASAFSCSSFLKRLPPRCCLSSEKRWKLLGARSGEYGVANNITLKFLGSTWPSIVKKFCDATFLGVCFG